MQANFSSGSIDFRWFLVSFCTLVMAIIGSKTLQRFHGGTQKTRALTNVSLWNYYALISLSVSIVVILLGWRSMKGPVSFIPFLVTIAFCRFCYGFLTPAYNTLLNNYIPPEHSKERATIMSWGSMLVSFLTICLIFPSSGPSGARTTLGWILPGSILFIVTGVLYFLMRRYQRKIGEIPSSVAVPVAEGD